MASRVGKLFRTSLAFQMGVATLLGIFCGLFFGDLCEVFAPYASAYIMILKITAVPYLIGAIIHGVGQLSTSQAKMILKKGVIFILMAWTINILMIYGTYFAFPQAKTSEMAGYIASNVPPINFSELLIPENIFYDLSHNIIPAVVIFSLLVGLALMHVKEKQVLIQAFQLLVECLTKITGWIAKITPIGTFIIIAHQAGTIEFSTVKQVSCYIILYILCLSTIIFWVFPRLTGLLTSIPSHRWLQQMFPILLLAYTTNIVIICLPYIIELLRKETLSIDPFDEKAQTQIQGTVSVIFNLPMGSLFISLFILFISLFYNAPLHAASQIKLFLTTFLSSLGAMGIGSWINSLTFILDSLGLPQEAVSLFLTTLPFTSGFQAMISATQVTTISLLIILASRRLLQFRLSSLIKGGLLTALPIVVLFLGIRTFNPLPPIKNEKKSIFELSISSTIPVSTPTASHVVTREGDLPVILQSKKLRVGYMPLVAPFCFYNCERQAVGYDIAFAYELAYDLGCDLELVPMNYAKLGQELQEGLYDIAMSAVSITEERLKQMTFTSSYLHPQFVFVTQGSGPNKRYFSHLSTIKSHPHRSIAVLKNTSYERIARELFPKHKIVALEQPDDFIHSSADAFFWTEEEAIAWSLCHREFRVVFPSPEIGRDTLAYAVKAENTQLLHYLNEWLALKKTQGYTQRQYDLWVLEKTEIVSAQYPRWSIIRHLGWTE